MRWLAVRALGDHWSTGLTGEVRSSTFDNIALDMRIAPAIEWNVFPYAMYTRRQLRVLYSLGGSRTPDTAIERPPRSEPIPTSQRLEYSRVDGAALRVRD